MTLTLAAYPSLAGKTVLVTGGASGIGASIVTNLARCGACAAFIDIDKTSAEALVEDIQELGYRPPKFLDCDLLDLDRTAAAISELADKSSIFGLVNNAANDRRRPMEETDPEQFAWSVNVNLRHVYFCTQAVLPHMVRGGGGSIVNMSSLAWVRGTTDLQAYAACKAGIVGLTSSLAHKVGRHGIRVNVITPGAVMTEKQKRLWYDEAGQRAVLASQCLPETIVPDDVARLVLFLLSDDSRHITKQNIAVDGGR